MRATDRISKIALVLIAVFVGLIALRHYSSPDIRVAAQSPRFDYVYVVSALFIYKGQQGLLLMDKRNGNVWFIPRAGDEMQLRYLDPVMVTQIPLGKLDQAP